MRVAFVTREKELVADELAVQRRQYEDLAARQDNWDEPLIWAEFAYNNYMHISTGETPFMLDSGQYPRMGFEPACPSMLESVNEFKTRIMFPKNEDTFFVPT